MPDFRLKNLNLVEAALRFLQAERPMTLLQIFYRLVSAGTLPSTDKPHYKRLGYVMTRIREARVIPLTWIVDHLRMTLKPPSWSGLAEFGNYMQRVYRKNLWADSMFHLEFFVEKDAIAGTIQPVTYEYDVPLRVCRGYASVSFAGEVVSLWSRIQKPIQAYYLGDFDPSGFDIERDLSEKLKRYSGVEFDWQRLGVLEADFDQFKLLPLKIKGADCRARAFRNKHGTRCAEIDALPPSELRRRVESEITWFLDEDKLKRLRLVEDAERQTIGKIFGPDGKLDLDSLSADQTGGEDG